MNQGLEDFPSVQGLGLSTFTTESLGSIPAQGTKIPQSMRHSKKKQQKNKRGKHSLRSPQKEPKLSGQHQSNCFLSIYRPRTHGKAFCASLFQSAWGKDNTYMRLRERTVVL